MHNEEYQKGIKMGKNLVLVQTAEWKNALTETNPHNQTHMFTRDRMKSAVKKCMHKCRYAAKNEEVWGIELKQGVRTYLQTLLLEKGSD